jgi:hypothetical protein
LQQLVVRRLVVLFAILLGSSAVGSPTGPPAPHRVDYGNPRNWLCLPGRDGVCSAPLTATVIGPGGGTAKRSYAADPNAPIDCFYVYPTVSRETAPNADMTASPEVQHAALEQFARFRTVCRLYAPLYRQVTLAGLNAGGADTETPYQDVLDAWNTYLARDNHGRGVVLIGHSQGSNILVRLIASQIDGASEQQRLISAIVPGTELDVPAGLDVGGTFQHISLCSTKTQTGCAIAYSSFVAASPPGPDAYFGASAKRGDVDACVDAASLDGSAALDAELPAIGAVSRAFGTTFVETPGQLSARCATNAGHAYLAISVSPDAPVLRATLSAMQGRRPNWGLHAFDVNLVLGNLVDLVAAESHAWLSAHPAVESAPHGAQ